MFTEEECKLIHTIFINLQWKVGASKQLIMSEVIVKKISDKYGLDGSAKNNGQKENAEEAVKK